MQIAVDGARRGLTGANREDDRGGAGDDVTAREYAFLTGFQSVLVSDDVAALVEIKSTGALGEQWIGLGADRDDDRVHLDAPL